MTRLMYQRRLSNITTKERLELATTLSVLPWDIFIFWSVYFSFCFFQNLIIFRYPFIYITLLFPKFNCLNTPKSGLSVHLILGNYRYKQTMVFLMWTILNVYVLGCIFAITLLKVTWTAVVFLTTLNQSIKWLNLRNASNQGMDWFRQTEWSILPQHLCLGDSQYDSDQSRWGICFVIFVLFCLFCCFTSEVNSYGRGGTVSSPTHTFFLGKLELAVNQFFMHILLLVTDTNPSWMIQGKGGEWTPTVARHVTNCATRPSL